MLGWKNQLLASQENRVNTDVAGALTTRLRKDREEHGKHRKSLYP